MSTTRQVIVVRKDLNMRKGKIASQAAHASMAFLSKIYMTSPSGVDIFPLIFKTAISEVELEWLRDSFTKICLYVNSEDELMEIFHAAEVAGLVVNLITDNGTTEFGGIPTKTCLAIGPDYKERIDPITKHLKLL